MPPTAHDIKARLDKAVDEDGNVLNMAATLEIVAMLEKLTMTKETLETTRIGRTINLMRKKTSSDDLARRAKKLLKKWQTLVNSHLKTLNPSLNRSVQNNPASHSSTPTTLVNGLITNTGALPERPKSCTMELNENTLIVSGKKRKCLSVDSHKQGRASSLSPKSKAASPKPEKGYLSKHEVTSPKIKVVSSVGSPKNVTSNRKRKFRHRKVPSPYTISQIAQDFTMGTESKLTTFGEDTAFSRCSSSSPEGFSISNIETNGDVNKHLTGSLHPEVTVDTPSDTRIQEDRITSKNNVSVAFKDHHHTTVLECENSLVSSQCSHRVTMESKLTDNTQIQECGRVVDKEKLSNEQNKLDIEPESLSVSRKEFPINIKSPSIEADGVNGTFNDALWHDWSSMIHQSDNELIILPYLILH